MPRGRRWKQPIRRCCFARRPGRYAAGWAISPLSCAGRRSKASTRAAGISISHWSTARAAAICSCRSASANISRRWAAPFSAGLMTHAAPCTAVCDPDGQWLPAISAELARARPGHLVLRSSRRDDPRAGRPRRSGDAAGEPRSASRPPIPTSISCRRSWPGSTASRTSSIRVSRTMIPTPPTGRMLPASLPAALDALEREPLFRAQLGEVFVDYFLKLKRNEAGRFAPVAQGCRQAGRTTSRPSGSRTSISIFSNGCIIASCDKAELERRTRSGEGAEPMLEKLTTRGSRARRISTTGTNSSRRIASTA